MQSYFEGICAKARQLIDLPKSWKRWATADREPIGQWTFGRVTLLGDAAHPTLQYMAQGACMALEDAVTLGEALRVHDNDYRQGLRSLPALAHHAHRAHRAVGAAKWAASFTPRGSSGWCAIRLWKDRPLERFYDAMEWLYGWNVGNCLAKD